MIKTYSTIVVFILWAIVSLNAQLWTEDFEVNGLGITYTSPSVFTINLNSHYNRTNGGNISNTVSPYAGKHGSFIWAGENINSTGPSGDGLTNKTITFAPIPVSGQTNLQFRGLFGSGNPQSGWDFSDILYVEYKMDAGAWTKMIQFAANAPLSNVGMYHDINLNGIGEGVALATTMKQFTANIPVTGISLQIRLFSKCSAQGEEFAFDYLRLYSTTIPVAGCIDPISSNYDVTATNDDGSCNYNGCTNPLALNFNSQATTDNGTCILSVPNIVINEIHYNPNDFSGVTDLSHEFIELHNNTTAALSIAGWRVSDAIDYTFPAATTIAANAYIVLASTSATYAGNGYPVYQYSDNLSNSGETIRLSTNSNVLVDLVTYYNNACWPTAADGGGPSLELRNFFIDNNEGLNYCTGAVNNGTPGNVNSCYSAIFLGCTNAIASNYDPDANTDDGSCLIMGCICPDASNYNSTANVDDGSCIYPSVVPGCTYIGASNYNPLANVDNGSCVYPSSIPGCTCATALNYNPLATIDNGTCAFPIQTVGCTYSVASNYNALATLDNGSCLFVISSTCPADLNGDTFIGVTDLLLFIAAYGTTCP